MTALGVYSYDPEGRRSGLGMPLTQSSYGYDAASRLQSLTRNLAGVDQSLIRLQPRLADVKDGTLVGGKDHVAKAKNTLGWIRRNLTRLKKNKSLSEAEKQALQDLFRLRDEIKEALQGK